MAIKAYHYSRQHISIALSPFNPHTHAPHPPQQPHTAPSSPSPPTHAPLIGATAHSQEETNGLHNATADSYAHSRAPSSVLQPPHTLISSALQLTHSLGRCYSQLTCPLISATATSHAPLSGATAHSHA